MGELVHQDFQGHSVLEGVGYRPRERVHQTRDGRPLFGHVDEDLARAPVVVQTHGDIAFVAGDVELVSQGLSLHRHLPLHRTRRVFRLNIFTRFGIGDGIERLDALASVTVDGNGLEAELPSLDVRLHDLFDRAFSRHVDRLGDSTGEERLDGGHHLDVTHVRDGAASAGGNDRAVEYRQVLFAKGRGPFDEAVLVNVVDDGLHLMLLIAQTLERGRNRLVDYLHHSAAH